MYPYPQAAEEEAAVTKDTSEGKTGFFSDQTYESMELDSSIKLALSEMKIVPRMGRTGTASGCVAKRSFAS